MHFYDSVVVFERGVYTGKYAPMRGGTFEMIAERTKAKLRRDRRVSAVQPQRLDRGRK
jgi:hypothetical protein